MKDLLAWFGFKRYPFDKEIKTADVVDTPVLKETLARLDYMKRRGGIMLLTGDPGVGKTIATRRFADTLNENLFKVLYTPLSTLNRSDILRHINALLGLQNRFTKSANYQQIQKELLACKEQRGRTVVLIIDEAHLLKPGPLEEIRLLTNFKMDSFDPFLLILSGQSDLKRMMDYAVMEPLNQRIRMRYHMTGLSEKDTTNYISSRLTWAGRTDPVFNDDALAAIQEYSYGFPRLIGNICEEAMTYAMFCDKKTVDADMILKIKTTADLITK
jgi:type II secretory pathway predicted ATPase ExeA